MNETKTAKEQQQIKRIDKLFRTEIFHTATGWHFWSIRHVLHNVLSNRSRQRAFVSSCHFADTGAH